jgi:DeoR family transcriptional regulator, fructose operon transcriptional repressor
MIEITELAAERQETIKKILKLRGDVRVDDLCSELHISAATARRDLSELDQRGAARRVHGGAVSLDGMLDEQIFDDKTNIAAKQKQKIAELAVSLIKPTDSIYLDGGSTILPLARLLTDMHRLTVVTNSLRVASLLSGNGPRLILVGGDLRRISQTFVGPMTQAFLQQIYLDTAFMGTIGLSEKEGLTTTDPAEAFTKTIVLSRARRVIVLADSSKLGKISFANFGKAEDMETLITDEDADPAILARLKKRGVRILQHAHNSNTNNGKGNRNADVPEQQ